MTKNPILKKNAYSYYNWMVSIQFGKTPDGKKLTGINFVNSGSRLYVGHFNDNEFVGEAIFLDYQFEKMGDCFVELTPGSIVVHLREVLGSIDYRQGIRIDICPEEVA